MGLYNQRKQEGQFLLLSEHRCPIRMNLEVGVLPHERSHNPHGVGEVIENEQTNLSIRWSDFVSFPIPGYFQESPPLFPAIVDNIPELWRKLLLKGIIEGRKNCPWYFVNVQMVFYQREVIRCSAISNPERATNCKEADITGILHVSVHPGRYVF